MRGRLHHATTIRALTVNGPDAKERWQEVISDLATNEKYIGTKITPREGLLPLPRNPRTGLWEFWHVLSGDSPEPNPAWEFSSGGDVKPGPGQSVYNRWLMKEDTGLVFVLIPRGMFNMGAEKFTLGVDAAAAAGPVGRLVRFVGAVCTGIIVVPVRCFRGDLQQFFGFSANPVCALDFQPSNCPSPPTLPLPPGVWLGLPALQHQQPPIDSGFIAQQEHLQRISAVHLHTCARSWRTCLCCGWRSG